MVLLYIYTPQIEIDTGKGIGVTDSFCMWKRKTEKIFINLVLTKEINIDRLYCVLVGDDL